MNKKNVKTSALFYVFRPQLLLIVFIIFLSSCAAVGKYNPDPKIATGSVEGINITNTIKISNSQPSTIERTIKFRGIIVNYNTFTQSLVEALKMEYERNKVKVNNSADKELQVIVIDVSMYRGAWNYSGVITAEVKYGNGSIERFSAKRSSYASGFNIGSFPTKPLDSAFKDLVANIIKNENILNYINQ